MESHPLDHVSRMTTTTRWGGWFYGAYFGVLGLVLPFLGPFLAARGLGAVGIGLVTSCFSLTKLAYAPVVGRLVDQGRWFRGVLSAHIALAIAAACAVPWIKTDWTLALVFLLVGLGHGTVLPLVEAAVLEKLPTPGYGQLRLWGSVGFVVVAVGAGRLVGGARIEAFPWALAGALALLAVTCQPFERAARPIHRNRDGRLPASVWILLMTLTLHQVSHGPYYAFFSIHLQAAGYGSTAVAMLWSLGVLAELVAFRSGHLLERRLGLKLMLSLALAVTPLRWLLLALPPTLPVLVLAQFGHAASFAVAHLAGVQLVQRLVPPGTARRAQALYSGCAFGLGIVAGTAVAGPLYAGVSGRGSFAVAALFSTLLAISWTFITRHFTELVDDNKETRRLTPR